MMKQNMTYTIKYTVPRIRSVGVNMYLGTNIRLSENTSNCNNCKE